MIRLINLHKLQHKWVLYNKQIIMKKTIKYLLENRSEIYNLILIYTQNDLIVLLILNLPNHIIALINQITTSVFYFDYICLLDTFSQPRLYSCEKFHFFKTKSCYFKPKFHSDLKCGLNLIYLFHLVVRIFVFIFHYLYSCCYWTQYMTLNY